jgi:hypothetical protein
VFLALVSVADNIGASAPGCNSRRAQHTQKRARMPERFAGHLRFGRFTRQQKRNLIGPDAERRITASALAVRLARQSF